MKTLLKFMLSAVLLTGFSCSTDDSYVDTNKFESQTEILSRSGSSNPFDYLGELHNSFMTEMHTLKPSKDKIPDLALEFVKKNGYDTSKFDSKAVSAIMNESMITDFTKEKIDEWGNRYRYSDEYKRELYKLADFFNKDSYQNPDDIVSQLKAIEASYLQAKLSEQEKQQLLATIAIARHSTDYWISFYPKDSGKENSADTDNKRRWFARIFGGVLSDVAGAIFGAIGGPVGSVIGAVAASGGVQAIVDDNL